MIGELTVENIIQRSKGYVEPTGPVASAIADVLAFDAKHEMTERVILIRPDGTELFRKDGEKGNDSEAHVHMDKSVLSRAKGCIAVHNHPVPASLSCDDIALTDAWKCKGIWAACKDDSRFYCEGFTEKAKTACGWRDMHMKSSVMLTTLVIGLRSAVQGEVVSADEASSVTDHLLLLGLNALGYLKDYQFSLGDPIVKTLDKLESDSPSFRTMHRHFLLRSGER